MRILQIYCITHTIQTAIMSGHDLNALCCKADGCGQGPQPVTQKVSHVLSFHTEASVELLLRWTHDKSQVWSSPLGIPGF